MTDCYGAELRNIPNDSNSLAEHLTDHVISIYDFLLEMPNEILEHLGNRKYYNKIVSGL